METESLKEVVVTASYKKALAAGLRARQTVHLKSVAESATSR